MLFYILPGIVVIYDHVTSLLLHFETLKAKAVLLTPGTSSAGGLGPDWCLILPPSAPNVESCKGKLRHLLLSHPPCSQHARTLSSHTFS